MHRYERERERETEIFPWPTGIDPFLPIELSHNPIRGRGSNPMTYGDQLLVQDPIVDHVIPNPDADATALEQHSPQREECKLLSIYRMCLAIKLTLGEMLTYSCILFSIERKTIKLV